MAGSDLRKRLNALRPQKKAPPQDDPAPTPSRLAPNPKTVKSVRSYDPDEGKQLPGIEARNDHGAYQLMLQEVGALYQTMHLVAALHDLAACPVGAFPERAVAEILGVDSLDEAQVGWFAVGLRATDEAALPRIVSVRPVEHSPFAGGYVGVALELTLHDGMRRITPASDLVTQRDASGRTICSLRGGRPLGIVDDGIRDELTRAAAAARDATPAAQGSRGPA